MVAAYEIANEVCDDTLKWDAVFNATARMLAAHTFVLPQAQMVDIPLGMIPRK